MSATKDFEYEKRDLAPMELDVVSKLKESKSQYGDIVAYCTTVCPVKLITWNGTLPAADNMQESIVPAGTTLKIVMVSKFNDFGLTDLLDETHNFKVRVPTDAAILADIRMTVEPSSAHATMDALVAYGLRSQTPEMKTAQ